MTLILSVNSPESMWMLADRRLSYANHRFRDDARKLMFLDTTDGVAVLGYAGLGETEAGTEPADWMSAVLRGRNVPLEQSLGVLADAAKRQLPRHMLRLPRTFAPMHSIIVSAFVNNERRIYTIDLKLTLNRTGFLSRITRRHSEHTPGVYRPPRVGITGSGASHLLRNMMWKRHLLNLVRAHNREKVSTLAIADYLAALNLEVHRGTADQSVGERCIVAWRHRKGGVHKGGGGQAFYTATDRDPNTASLPTISQGTDISALVALVLPHALPLLQRQLAGHPVEDLDNAALNEEFKKLPDKPDETLR